MLEDLGKAIVNMTEYGIPQNRKRIIILGLNKSYYGAKCEEMIERFYKEILPSHKVDEMKTVYDAIGDLPKLFPLSEPIKYNGNKQQ